MQCDHPRYITWEVTSACNHRCVFCYNGENVVSAVPNRADEIAQFIIEQKPVCVSLSGGEALLFFDELKKYIDLFAKHAINVRIQTNGALITEQIAAYCVQHRIDLMVSFPSCDEQVFEQIVGKKQSFERVLNSLKVLHKYRVDFQPNIVVTKLNLHTVKETICFLHEQFHPRGIFVSRATKAHSAEKSFEEIMLNNEELCQLFDDCAALAGKYNINIKSCGGYPLCLFRSQDSYSIFGKVCGAGKNDFVLSNSGDVRVCTRDDRVYGNVFEEPLQKILERMSEWTEPVVPLACTSCNKKDVCHGGCHMASLEKDRHAGSLDVNADPNNTPVRYKHTKKLPRIRFFTRYSVLSATIVDEGSCCRISQGMAYGYFTKETGLFLQSKQTCCLLIMAFSLRQSLRETGIVLSRLLTIGAIAEVGKKLKKGS